MSFSAMQWALSREKITPLEKLTLVVLADLASWDLQCWPTRAQLARRLGVGSNSVTTALRSLERAELIKQTCRPAPGARRCKTSISLLIDGVAA